jgi:hypothetical protein
MMKKDDQRLRIGLLGCGPIAQAAHLDAIRKARNAELSALCDAARGLAAACQPAAERTTPFPLPFPCVTAACGRNAPALRLGLRPAPWATFGVAL